MNTRETGIQAAENNLKQLMADLSRAVRWWCSCSSLSAWRSSEWYTAVEGDMPWRFSRNAMHEARSITRNFKNDAVFWRR